MAEPRLNSCVPLPIKYSELQEVVGKAKDWALMHGAGLRIRDHYDEDSLYVAPFTLFPSAFPKKEFHRAISIQSLMNELVHKVAYNHTFLSESLSNTVHVDDFTGNLYKIYEAVRKEGIAQDYSLGLFRSDYLPHTGNASVVKQVEVNTIASSISGLCDTISLLHRYVLTELGHFDLLDNVPENNALQGMCQGLLDAWTLYGEPNSAILFVVEPITYNICDQRSHEFEIRKMNSKVKIIRRTFEQLSEEAKLKDPHKILHVQGMEVAVVYYRAGYVPTDYKSQKHWDVRMLLERSRAIKCPSIQYHLAGTKKIQQVLAQPNVLEKFFTDDPDKIKLLREVFTGLYSLDFDDTGDKAVEMALAAPEKFVLKPQREGGGNNLFGLDIARELKKMKNSPERSAWILMERIIPPIQSNYIVRAGNGSDNYQVVDIIGELGIYGVIIGSHERIVVNRQAGHMLRSKLASVDETGVAAGFGAVDSPYLV